MATLYRKYISKMIDLCVKLKYLSILERRVYGRVIYRVSSFIRILCIKDWFFPRRFLFLHKHDGVVAVVAFSSDPANIRSLKIASDFSESFHCHLEGFRDFIAFEDSDKYLIHRRKVLPSELTVPVRTLGLTLRNESSQPHCSIDRREARWKE